MQNRPGKLIEGSIITKRGGRHGLKLGGAFVNENRGKMLVEK